MRIKVVRLSHRLFRDQRITTHCALVSRAFGADGFVYSGERDTKLEATTRKVASNWGGRFSCEYADSYMRFIKAWKKNGGLVAHLTVYGLPVQKVAPKLRKLRKPLLLVVGGEKVPPEVYQAADWNVAVTGQPHSEVAALAMMLDRIFSGRELEKKFPKARLAIVPQERGKRVIRK
ncbi:MAG: tRNA (cytidine(56)-2'-O)-methyltransferase [Candidatus Aenigmarchaeota archaeon]|nr:tRNA (cytidine(56)-2'-O)-methyltransferase [Candidatus Aenigmarchaeota archaeon]